MGRYADGKSQRGFVIEDATWDAAAAVAKERGESVSEVIRRALEEYAAEGAPKKAAARRAPAKAKGSAAPEATSPARSRRLAVVSKVR